MSVSDDRSGRDTRLLALVIVIAIAVLLVLARFRFPATDTGPVAVTPGPLDRLAARATFDDLASAVQSVLPRVAPSVTMLELEGSPPEMRQGIAVRLRPNLAVMRVPPGFHVIALADADAPAVRATEPVREAAVVSLPAGDGTERAVFAAHDFAGFAYVAVVEAAAGGPTATPAFIGRVDAVSDPRWGAGVLAVGGTVNLPPGALVFLLDGRFVGLVVTLPHDGRGLATPAALEAFLGSTSGGGAGIRP